IGHVAFSNRGGVVVGRPEDQLMDVAAEFGPHHPLSRHGVEDDKNRLTNLFIIVDQRNAIQFIQMRRKRPSSPNNIRQKICSYKSLSAYQHSGMSALLLNE